MCLPNRQMLSLSFCFLTSNSHLSNRKTLSSAAQLQLLIRTEMKWTGAGHGRVGKARRQSLKFANNWVKLDDEQTTHFNSTSMPAGFYRNNVIRKRAKQKHVQTRNESRVTNLEDPASVAVTFRKLSRYCRHFLCL